VLTNIPSIPADSVSEYPTKWHPIDALNGVECRQLSDDTYQLRSPITVITINAEGFALYRDHTFDGQLSFNVWLRDNNIVAYDRKSHPNG